MYDTIASDSIMIFNAASGYAITTFMTLARDSITISVTI